MGRFFINKNDIKNGDIIVSGREARHMIEVMRFRLGQTVTMFDGEGMEYRGQIRVLDRNKKVLKVSLEETKDISSEIYPVIVLAQAIPKKNKMDLIVEKATELGVSRIIPMVTERTEVRPEKRSMSKMTERWRRIAIEASKQCSCPVTPRIDPIMLFKDVVKYATNYDLNFLACLYEGTVPIKAVIPSPLPKYVLVMVGPEGDFSIKEAEFAHARNFTLISLGPRVLKSDTAGLFLLSVIGYEGGLFSPGKTNFLV